MIDDYGNIVVYMNKFPVNACTTLNEDGSYTIFINASLSDKKKMECYLHELFHINNDDFFKSDVQEIEKNAHDNDKKRR